jgi:hypothetical protein
MTNTCHYCSVSTVARELRPYGPNGSMVCFDCAMSTDQRRRETEANLRTQLNVAGPVIMLDDSGVGPYPAEFHPAIATLIGSNKDKH